MVTEMPLRVLAFALIACATAVADAHGDTHGDPAARKEPTFEVTAFGQTGDPKKVTRTINVVMDDGFHYTPGKLSIKKGETVRIVARNKGKLLHEIVIGSPEELSAHAELMRKFPNMEHEAAYMAHVPPGKSEEIVWQFTKAGDFKFGCLVAGHFEAGMVGDISVR
ncbi:MAG: cupredoxin family protein [Betaproteobacteria bacterium]